MAAAAMGPTMAGGTEPIVEEGYELLYLPDVNNDALQREGKAPVYYYVPNSLRLAREGGRPDGDYLFNLIRFAGVQDPDTTVGAEEHREVAGGVLSLTVTGAVPDEVLKASQKKIIEKWNAKKDVFWGIRSRVAPDFRPAIITSNTTSISNVSPNPVTRGVPARSPAGRASNGATGLRSMGYFEARDMPMTVPEDRSMRSDSNLDPWYWRMQGQGPGGIVPTAPNAYSALLGAYPTAILWESFHGSASPLFVCQDLQLKVWTPVVELTIKGNWSKIFDHFSTAFHAHYLFASVDISTELNKMRQRGTIEVDLKVDQTIPNADEVAKQIEKRSDLVFNKFMEQAQKVIFEPGQPEVEAAKASKGGFWGASFALKKRKDITTLNLNYREKRQIAHLQQHVVKSSLIGMFDELKADPDAEKKYFRSVFLDDWPRKLARVVRPVVNWPDPARSWIGEPVAFVEAQVGYPNTDGELQWTGRSFQDNSEWSFGITQKRREDVANPPGGWEPGVTFVKRKVHLLEPPSELENPYARVQVDKDVIDIDPEPNGTPLNDVTLEVRADSAGRLAVGPIEIGAMLDDARQTVEATLEATDDQGQPLGREAVRFTWSQDDQEEPRYWAVYTGDPAVRPFFRYKVRVIVKGSLFQKGMEWEGPWVEAVANGPITLSVPMADDPGVTTRDMAPFLDELPPMPRVREGVPASSRGVQPVPERVVEIGGRTAADAPEAGDGAKRSRKRGKRSSSRAVPAAREDETPPEELEIASFRGERS